MKRVVKWIYRTTTKWSTWAHSLPLMCGERIRPQLRGGVEKEKYQVQSKTKKAVLGASPPTR
jgi:hypothetical protein